MLPGDSIGLLPGSRNVKYQYVENTFKYLIGGIGGSCQSSKMNGNIYGGIFMMSPSVEKFFGWIMYEADIFLP